jgi:hypothetical protein
MTKAGSETVKLRARKKRRDMPSLKPIDIDKDTWCYEGEKSLHFVHWFTTPNGQKVCASFAVPWRKIKGTYPARRSLGEG